MKWTLSFLCCCFCLSVFFVGLANSQTEQKDQGDKKKIFVPFRHISGIFPGKSRLSDVIKIFGEPNEELDCGINKGSHIIKYTNLGLSFLIPVENMKQGDPLIDATWVEAPYIGRSPKGLHIGMSRKKALDICACNYYQTLGSQYASQKSQVVRIISRFGLRMTN